MVIESDIAETKTKNNQDVIGIARFLIDIRFLAFLALYKKQETNLKLSSRTERYYTSLILRTELDAKPI